MASTAGMKYFQSLRLPFPPDHGRTDRAKEPLARGKTRNAISPCVSIRFKHAGSSTCHGKIALSINWLGKPGLLFSFAPPTIALIHFALLAPLRIPMQCRETRWYFSKFSFVISFEYSRREVFTGFRDFSYLCNSRSCPCVFYQNFLSLAFSVFIWYYY